MACLEAVRKTGSIKYAAMLLGYERIKFKKKLVKFGVLDLARDIVVEVKGRFRLPIPGGISDRK